MNNRVCEITLTALAVGTHEFEYDLDDAFFASFGNEEVTGGRVHASVTVAKNQLQCDVTVHVEGELVTFCDRCLDPLTVPVENDEEFVAKVGECADDEDEDLVTVAADDPRLCLDSRLYQMCVVAMPIMRVHAEGECNPEMIEILRAHQADASVVADAEEKKSDPRWDALKDIINK